MCHILLGVGLPACFQMTRDDLERLEALDDVQSFLPCFQDLWGLDFFDPSDG